MRRQTEEANVTLPRRSPAFEWRSLAFDHVTPAVAAADGEKHKRVKNTTTMQKDA